MFSDLVKKMLKYLFQAFLSETHEQQVSSISEITWRQRKIQVTNEKVRLFFLNLQEFETELKVKDKFKSFKRF